MAAGRYSFTIEQGATVDFEVIFNEWFYDLELMSGSGDCMTVTRLLMGQVRLSDEVTTGQPF